MQHAINIPDTVASRVVAAVANLRGVDPATLAGMNAAQQAAMVKQQLIDHLKGLTGDYEATLNVASTAQALTTAAATARQNVQAQIQIT